MISDPGTLLSGSRAEPGRRARLLGVSGLLLILIGSLLFWRMACRAERVDADAGGSLPVAAAPSPAASAAAAPAVPAAAPAPPPAVSPPAPVPAPVGPDTIRQADELAAGDRHVEARELCLKALAGGPADGVRTQLEARIGRANIELAFTPRASPEKSDYVVQKGDSIGRIASRNGTTAELLQRANLLAQPNLIKVGDRLKVYKGKFSLTVSKSRNDLVAQVDGRFFKRYPVGTGKFGKTPVGTFVVSDRIKEPVWWRPDGRAIPYGDKENILGTRWLALKATGQTPDAKGYGIHGTWDPSSIGKAESAGCIRMRNEDVEELFVLVPLNTPVAIEE
jgi:lipoprotein-anchoring transpeptidase ErfK/SrfK